MAPPITGERYMNEASIAELRLPGFPKKAKRNAKPVSAPANSGHHPENGKRSEFAPSGGGVGKLSVLDFSSLRSHLNSRCTYRNSLQVFPFGNLPGQSNVPEKSDVLQLGQNP